MVGLVICVFSFGSVGGFSWYLVLLRICYNGGCGLNLVG